MRVIVCGLLLCSVLAGNAATRITIACIGNSITYGYGLPEQDRLAKSYPGRLQSLLGTSNYTIENDGVSATTLLKNGDNPYWRNGRLPQVFAFQPDIVTIKLGTNDTKPQNWDVHRQEFKGDYLAMIDTLSSMASKPKIWLVLPVPVVNHPTGASWGIRDSVIRKIIPIIREIAAERGLPVIDANTPLQPFPQYFSVDGVHPSAAGLDTIARVVYRALRGAVATVPQAILPHERCVSGEENLWRADAPFSRRVGPSAPLFDLTGRKIPGQRTALPAGVFVFSVKVSYGDSGMRPGTGP